MNRFRKYKGQIEAYAKPKGWLKKLPYQNIKDKKYGLLEYEQFFVFKGKDYNGLHWNREHVTGNYHPIW